MSTKDEQVAPDPAVRTAIVDDASFYFEALVATGKAADGLTLLDQVVEAVPTGRAFSAFMQRTTLNYNAQLPRHIQWGQITHVTR